MLGRSITLRCVETELTEVRENRGVYGDIAWPAGKVVAPRKLAGLVAAEFKLDPEQLCGRSVAAREAKKLAVELSCRYSNLSDRRVGECFGYKGNGAVQKQRCRLKEQLASNRKLKRAFNKLEALLVAT